MLVCVLVASNGNTSKLAHSKLPVMRALLSDYEYLDPCKQGHPQSETDCFWPIRNCQTRRSPLPDHR